MSKIEIAVLACAVILFLGGAVYAGWKQDKNNAFKQVILTESDISALIYCFKRRGQEILPDLLTHLEEQQSGEPTTLRTGQLLNVLRDEYDDLKREADSDDDQMEDETVLALEEVIGILANLLQDPERGIIPASWS